MRAARAAGRAADLISRGFDLSIDAVRPRRTTVEHRAHDAMMSMTHDPIWPLSSRIVLECPIRPEDLLAGSTDARGLGNALRDASSALMSGRRSDVRPSMPQETAETIAHHCYHLGPDEIVVRPPFGELPATVWLRSGRPVPDHVRAMITDCTPAVRVGMVHRDRNARLARAEITIRVEPVQGRASTTVDPLAFMRMLADGIGNGASDDAPEKEVMEGPRPCDGPGLEKEL